MRILFYVQRLRVAVAGAAGVDQTAVPDFEPGPEIRRQNAQTPAGGFFLNDRITYGGAKATDYIMKPFDIEKLMRFIDEPHEHAVHQPLRPPFDP